VEVIRMAAAFLTVGGNERTDHAGNSNIREQAELKMASTA
jgi:hypothetical protein